MANQLHDSRAEAAALRKQRQTAETVLAHLHREEADAAARLEAARLELEVIRTQLAEQADKCTQVDMQQAELEQMATLVEQTQSSIELERQKALLLVHNFAPVLAEELRREFAV
jgi:chromosome segregation ATPase